MSINGSWQNVGQNIRSLRKSHQLTLKQLASGCGLSPNAISLIERGKVAPTVATLCKIAYALGAPASYFFQKVCPTNVILNRAGYSRPEWQPAQTFSIPACDILPNEDLPVAELDDWEGVEAYSAGFAFHSGFCICGQIEFETDGEFIRLGPGDNILFNRRALSRWNNPGNKTAIAMIVFSPQSHQSK